jgi:hypothetical protein
MRTYSKQGNVVRIAHVFVLLTYLYELKLSRSQTHFLTKQDSNKDPRSEV